MLAVGDTGCGMTPEVREHIFEPFFTTKKAGEGTGLGLPTVYGIVKQNGGFIDVTSEPGRGTTFRIYIPRCLEESEPKSDESPAEAEMPRGSGAVLLVEDDGAALRTTARFLEQLDYAVLPAQTPEEALRIAANYAGKIHLLLTDVVMPGMNGTELALRLSKLRPAIKVIYMSGYTMDIITHQGVTDEGVVLLSKPFNRLELARKIHEVLS